MKTVEKKEEIITKVYVTDDGREFATMTEARIHERDLKGEALEEYMDCHCIDAWGDEYSGLGAYIGAGLPQKYLILITDELIDLAREVNEDWVDSLEFYKGRVVFLAVEGFGKYSSWHVGGTLDSVINALDEDLKTLKKYYKEN